MINYIQKGENLTLVAPSGGVIAGRFYVIGTLVVVAMSTVAVGESFVGVTGGVFSHAKLSAQAWTQGAAVYWDAVANLLTTVSTDNTLVGPATAAAANPSGTGYVLLRQN